MASNINWKCIIYFQFIWASSKFAYFQGNMFCFCFFVNFYLVKSFPFQNLNKWQVRKIPFWTLKFYVEIYIYMLDADQRPDPNWCPLTSLSQITIRFKGILKSASFRNSQIYGLGHMSLTSFDFDLGKWEPIIDLIMWKKDIDLRYRCLWLRNRTWIWGLDVDMNLTYIFFLDPWTTMLVNKKTIPVFHFTIMLYYCHC